jgi:hypothetical protein
VDYAAIVHIGPPSVVQELTEEMAERISATIGQENITRPNERNVEQK